jgi:hypothetical protein
MFKRTSILMLLPFFVFLRLAFAQTSPSKKQTGFQPGPGFPGFPGSVPMGMRWVPGHTEIRNGRQVWIPGGYKTGDDKGSTTLPSATPNVTPNPQGAPGSVPSRQGGFVRPFSKDQQGGSKKWIPGHFKEIKGKQTWIRGHYEGEQAMTTGPPGGIPGAPAAGGTVSEKLKEQGSNVKPQGWAIIIGVSEYQYAAGKFPELRYAANDAKGFYDFLRSPEGGGIPPERILFLENDRATLDNIKYAFFEFAKQALEEDYVIIYYAGHGTPEENNYENLYLMAYDSKPDRIASTAFPMWDIDTAFTRHIKSKKVIMFADACHSAGIVSDIATRSINQKNMVNEYLLNVAQSQKGLVIFTGSEAGELSQESRKWGGGHGVFTYFLLNGLKGEADVNEDSTVTLGELIDFVSENVRRSTKNAQHPSTAGKFDRMFPIANFQH